MVLNMPTQTLVLIVIALVLLTIGLLAIAQASGLTLPLFEQIDQLVKALTGGKTV